MIKNTTIAVAICTLLLLAAGFHATVGARAKSVVDGVYSAAQVKRGATLYAEQCASCHGDMLEGIAGLFPALKGDMFLMNWTGKSVGDLFTKTGDTMPAVAPGSLKPDQVADLVAYMLSASKYPTGSADMPTGVDALKEIQIVAPKP